MYPASSLFQSLARWGSVVGLIVVGETYARLNPAVLTMVKIVWLYFVTGARG